MSLININLLPWREARRDKRTRFFYGVLLLMLSVGGALGWGVSHIYQQQLVDQQLRNTYITSHINRLNNEIAQVQRYQLEVEQLGAQLRLFQTLQYERFNSTRLFNDIASSLVDGVMYQHIARNGNRLTLSAQADSEHQVSDQLRQIASAPGLEVPTLSEVSSGQQGFGRLFRFEVVQSSMGINSAGEALP